MVHSFSLLTLCWLAGRERLTGFKPNNQNQQTAFTVANSSLSNPTPVALIGFGEAALALTEGWRSVARYASLRITAFDRKTEVQDADLQDVRNAKLADYQRAQATGLTFEGCESLTQALHGTTVIFSLVTADQALAAAIAASQTMRQNTLYLDGNSCSRNTKKAAAKIISEAGGRYVDMAIMSPIYPLQHKTPILLSGPHALAAKEFLDTLDMNTRIQGDNVGDASSIKMIRSIMVKGMEALTAECVLAARKAGVEDTVVSSLQQTFPEIDWPARMAYNLERMIKHGERRATEMQAVADTVADLGLNNAMTLAAAQWQQRIGELKLSVNQADYRQLADDIIGKLS